MYSYGHQLSPEAPIKVAAFTPPILGHQRIANFDVYSYPGPGSVLLILFVVILAAVLFFETRRFKKQTA
jgi:copper chaperone NosL